MQISKGIKFNKIILSMYRSFALTKIIYLNNILYHLIFNFFFSSSRITFIFFFPFDLDESDGDSGERETEIHREGVMSASWLTSTRAARASSEFCGVPDTTPLGASPTILRATYTTQAKA